MHRYSKTLLLAASLTVTGALAHAGQHPASATKTFTGQNLATTAKIDINAARAIALKVHPGKVTDEELEKEAGGSGLRYSFDIKDARGTYEVGVDAASGKVLENKLEGPNPD